QICCGQRVTGVAYENDQIKGVTVNGQIHPADKVILAAGSWSGQIEGLKIPVRPMKGQALAVEAPFVLTHTIHNEAGIIAPRRDGRILIGATVEDAGFDKRSTVEGVYGLLSSAMQFFPALKDATILETWAGLRPRAIDDWPVLGPVAGYNGLYISTGHFRNGILLAPATTQLIVDWVFEQTSTINVVCLSPNRFL
ncbi:MAG: FAD-dependent oxidoreductase, partial [Chloroflexota bacterium]